MTAQEDRPRSAHAQSWLLGLLGENIGGSLSPLLQESEAQRQGLPLIYRLLDSEQMGVAEPDWAALVSEAQRMSFNGLNVTHPAKQAIFPALDELTPDAELLGAVNTVVFREGQAIGMNTDHLGFSEALASIRTESAPTRMGHVVQLGAGGAGAATAYSLLQAGAERLSIADVDRERVSALIDRLSAQFDRSRMVALRLDEAPEAVRLADGLVNSTPIGMTGVSNASPVDVGALHSRLWVGDVVYRPLQTTLVRAAEALGCRVFGGGRMVVGQAVASFGMFTGRQADRDAMYEVFLEATRG